MRICSRWMAVAQPIAIGVLGETLQAAASDIFGTVVIAADGKPVNLEAAVVPAFMGAPLLGGVVGSLAACGLFKKIEDKPCCMLPLKVGCITALPVLSTMLGHAIRHATNEVAELSLAEVTTISAVGNGVLLSAVGFVVACVAAVSYGIKRIVGENQQENDFILLPGGRNRMLV